MKEVRIKKIDASKKLVYSKLHRPINESKFWIKIALQQQALIHAKNKT